MFLYYLETFLKSSLKLMEHTEGGNLAKIRDYWERKNVLGILGTSSHRSLKWRSESAPAWYFLKIPNLKAGVRSCIRMIICYLPEFALKTEM